METYPEGKRVPSRIGCGYEDSKPAFPAPSQAPWGDASSRDRAIRQSTEANTGGSGPHGHDHREAARRRVWHTRAAAGHRAAASTDYTRSREQRQANALEGRQRRAAKD